MQIRPAEVAGVAGVVAANVALNRAVPRSLDVPAGLAAAAGMVMLASAVGVSAKDMGMAPEAAPRGLRDGLLFGVPLALAAGLGAFFPLTSRFFEDDRVVNATPREAAYQLFVRIPLATAVTEEVIFRSALEGILAHHRSPKQTTLVSAAVFGAWHILTALDRTLNHPVAAETHRGDAIRQAGVIASVVAATGIASLGLSWVQRRTGSVVAPTVVHYAINGGAFLGGWLASRRK